MAGKGCNKRGKENAMKDALAMLALFVCLAVLAVL
jgi:hypothetical protein